MRQFYNTCNFGLQQFSFTEIPGLLLYFQKMRQGFYSECFLKKDIKINKYKKDCLSRTAMNFKIIHGLYDLRRFSI